jgi:hypothetical protein
MFKRKQIRKIRSIPFVLRDGDYIWTGELIEISPGNWACPHGVWRNERVWGDTGTFAALDIKLRPLRGGGYKVETGIWFEQGTVWTMQDLILTAEGLLVDEAPPAEEPPPNGEPTPSGTTTAAFALA